MYTLVAVNTNFITKNIYCEFPLLKMHLSTLGPLLLKRNYIVV